MLTPQETLLQKQILESLQNSTLQMQAQVRNLETQIQLQAQKIQQLIKQLQEN